MESVPDLGFVFFLLLIFIPIYRLNPYSGEAEARSAANAAEAPDVACITAVNTSCAVLNARHQL
jgi:hypothetical protein